MNIILKNKLLNKLLKNGVKTHPEKILKLCIKQLQRKSKKKHLEILKKSLINSSPVIAIKQIKRRKKKCKRISIYFKKKIKIVFWFKIYIKIIKT